MSGQPFLVAVAIGPVQDFIAAARRTRDLAYSSQLLSDLAKAVAAFLKSRGAELIFPAPTSDDELRPGLRSMIANKILCLWSGDQPATLLQDARAHLDQTWQAIADQALAQAKSQARGWKVATERFQKQVAQVIEFAGAYVPLARGSGGKSAFRVARDRVEELLAGTKALRDFAPFAGEAGVPKSSLDGARESVIQHAETPAQRRYGLCLQGHEQLCAVGLIKRFGGGDRAFPSTHHLAALPWMRRIAGQARPAVRALIDQLKAIPDIETTSHQPAALKEVWGDLSGAALFRSRVEQAWPAGDPRAGRHATLLEDLFKEAGSAPTPYFALLIGDGDKLGELIDTIGDGEDAMARQQELSRTLSRFAGQVGRLIRDHDGTLIYAGGDDVVAFLPLPNALTGARAIYQSYVDHLSPLTSPLGRQPGFSIGLAVGHALAPLQNTLDAARAAERLAKGPAGRNSLGIIIEKRSGSPTSTYLKWTDFDDFQHLADWFAQGLLPRGLPYEIRRLAADLATPRIGQGLTGPQFATIAQAEIQRILAMKKTAPGGLPSDLTPLLKRRLHGFTSAGQAVSPTALALLADHTVAALTFAHRRNPS